MWTACPLAAIPALARTIDTTEPRSAGPIATRVPNVPRTASRTVDLLGFDPHGLRALVMAAWFGGFPGAGDPPAAARRALQHLDRAQSNGTRDVYKVDRASLAALVAFLQRGAAVVPGDFLPTLRKVQARLQRGPGRPPLRIPALRAAPDVWASRARLVQSTAHRLQRANGYRPTDAQIEAALGLSRYTLGRWRLRKADVFGPGRAP